MQCFKLPERLPPKRPTFLLRERRSVQRGVGHCMVPLWVGRHSDKAWMVALNSSNGTNNNYSKKYLQSNNTGVKRITSPQLNQIAQNTWQNLSTRTSTEINTPAISAGGVLQTMLTQRWWHQHPQHRISSFVLEFIDHPKSRVNSMNSSTLQNQCCVAPVIT